MRRDEYAIERAVQTILEHYKKQSQRADITPQNIHPNSLEGMPDLVKAAKYFRGAQYHRFKLMEKDPPND